MTSRNKLILSALPLLAAMGAVQPALAQGRRVPMPAPAPAPAVAPTAAASFTAGTSVTDTQGGAVGTIVREDGEFVILKTDRHEVRLPKASFTAHQGGFIMAMTQAQVNAAVDQTLAQADARIVAGGTVSGSQGGTVGTIDAVDAQAVTVRLTSGALVRLPLNALAPRPNGAAVAMTVAELEAAAAAAVGAQAPAPDGAGGSPQ